MFGRKTVGSLVALLFLTAIALGDKQVVPVPFNLCVAFPCISLQPVNGCVFNSTILNFQTCTISTSVCAQSASTMNGCLCTDPLTGQTIMGATFPFCT